MFDYFHGRRQLSQIASIFLTTFFQSLESHSAVLSSSQNSLRTSERFFRKRVALTVSELGSKNGTFLVLLVICQPPAFRLGAGCRTGRSCRTAG